MVRLPPHASGRPARGNNNNNNAAHVAAVPNSTNNSNSSLLRRAANIYYWQAAGGGPAPLFSGPLGVQVGEAPTGTVIRELRRYQDPFNACWVATATTNNNNNNNNLIWARLTSNEGEDWHWQRVYDARLVNAATLNSGELGEEEEDVMLVGPASIDNIEGKRRSLPSVDHVIREIKLLEECWKELIMEINKKRNWNEEYQELVDLMNFGQWEQSFSASEKLREFIEEFSEAAEDAALTIISDMIKPSSERISKSINCGIVGTFFYNGLLVRLALDDASGNIKGDLHAWKLMSQFMQTRQILALEGPKRLLYTIPTAMITFAGFRICVTAIPPVEVKKIVSFPLQECLNNLDSSEVVKSHLLDLALSIGIKPHYIKSTKEELISIPINVDTIVVAGNDKRLYILNTSTFLPPIGIFMNEKKKINDSLSLRFRPEFLLSWGQPLNSDAFIEEVSTIEDNSMIMQATEYIKNEKILVVAETIGLHRAIDLPHQDSIECTLCSRIMENELRFIVCHNPKKCCHICSHCYTQRLIEIKKDTNNLFKDAVKCNFLHRRSKGLLIEPSLTSIFHVNGLNMRFLPFVYYSIPQVSKFAVAHYCEVEIIARAAVHVLREKLRRTAQTQDEVKSICQIFFLGLLQSSGATAKRFWAQELGPTITSLYGIQEPINTSELDIELLYHRVAEISGVFLDEASILSFHSEKPFLQIAGVRPLVKIIQPPSIGNEKSHEKIRESLFKKLENILLFWIGISENEENDNKNDIEINQPFYLTERENWV